jgi:hypothetical protein
LDLRVTVSVLATGALLIAMIAASSAAARPDGHARGWIYFLSYPGGIGCTASEVWRERPDGSSPQKVLPAAFDDYRVPPRNPGSQTDGEFAVSRTGRYIVRVLGTPTPLGQKNQAHLFVYDLRTGSVTQLTFGPFDDRWPAISPDGKVVAFTRTSYRRPMTFGGGAETTTTETIPISGGRPRPVNEHPEQGGGEISWLPDGTKFEQGAQVVRVFTGKATNWVSPAKGRYPLVISSTWTPLGVLYTSLTLYTQGPDFPGGLYLAPHPVKGVGTLLRRYRYRSHPPANGLYSMQLLPDRRTLLAQLGDRIVSGSLRGGKLHSVAVPGGVAARPRFAFGSSHPPDGAPTPAAGAAPSCAQR